MEKRTSAAGRPRTFNADTVLEEALRIFWHNGFRTTTTRALEEGLGLSQSSLYNAFGSKSDLLEAALDRYETRLEGELMEPLERPDSRLAALDDFVCALGRWITVDGAKGCMVVNLMAEQGTSDERIVVRTRAYRNRVRRALRGALDRADVAGELADGNKDARVELLLAALLGINIAARGGAEVSEMQGLIEGIRSQVAAWRR